MMHQHTVSPQNALSVRYTVRTNRSATFASVIVTLTLNTAQQFFMTLWLKTMYHHKKFGYKRFSGEDVIVQQTVTEIFNVFTVTLTSKTAMQYFQWTPWLMMIFHKQKI